MVQASPGEAEDRGGPSNYVLERGVDSQGSPPLLFHAGQQHGPVSLGRGGEFRIDGRGVLATHGYLMFDGEGVYLCSADEANPILADASRIPRDWTRVAVPCALVFGRSRAVLRRDGFLPDKPSGTSTTPYAPPRPSEAPTDVRRGGRAPEPAPDALENAQTPYDGVPAARGGPLRGALPKDVEETYRPKVPSMADDESTRMGPDLVAMGAQLPAFGDDESTRMQPDVLPRAPPARPAPRPAAGFPAAPPPQDVAYAPPPQLSYAAPQQYAPPGYAPGYGPPQGYAPPEQPYPQAPPGYVPPPPGYAQPPPGYAQPLPGYAQPPPGYMQPPPGYVQPPQAPPPPQPYAPEPQQPYAPAQPTQASPQQSYPQPPPKSPLSQDAPTAPAVPTKKGPNGVQRALEALRSGIQPGSPRRTPILVAGLSLIAISVASLVTVVRLRGAGPAPPPPVAQPLASPTPTAPPPPVASAAVPSGPVPIMVIPAPPRVETDAGFDSGKPVHGKPPPPPPPTLERNAVDAVNRGDLQAALTLYRQLATQQPDNPAFANAARLLQQRVGTPATP